jgi:signal transduction histidine kinase
VRHRHHHHQRPSATWMLARGLHRKVLGFLFVASCVGAAAGVGAHTAMASGSSWHGFLCIGLSFLFVFWWLSWTATFRIAWPVKELADVATDLQGGRLESKHDLPEGSAEVGQVANALRGMADRVGRQLRDQRALMAAVSHELRSPLGRARVLVEMAREGTAPPTVHDDLEAEIDAMDRLVGDLLAAARIDFEAISPKHLDATDAAQRALEIAHLPKATLIVHGVAGSVRADPTLLPRAIAGLLDNAKRYGGTTIQLHLHDLGERVRFEVTDDGPGFGPGELEQAFQPFFRGVSQAGTEKPPGEGLGLALVRQIAEAHRGEAGAASRDGGGARVWVEVPRG